MGRVANNLQSLYTQIPILCYTHNIAEIKENEMNALIKSLLLVGVLVASSLTVGHAYAIRCNGGIVDTGDNVNTLYSTCGQPDSSNGNVWGDRATLYYNQDGGMICAVSILNGNISNIDCNRD